MLVLSRKLGERILVPQCGLTVTIIAVDGKIVRLGIDAPAEVTVLREELVRQKKEAAKCGGREHSTGTECLATVSRTKKRRDGEQSKQR